MPEATPGQDETRRSQTRRQRPFAAIWAIILSILVVTALVLAAGYTLRWFDLGTMSCGTSGNVPASNHFTVVITQTGYNDSEYHTRPWPIMNVTQGQGVRIHVWNNSTFETHGFAITHYFDQGVALHPGQSCDLTFSASQAGTFRVFSITLDTTEALEQAQLNVNP